MNSINKLSGIFRQSPWFSNYFHLPAFFSLKANDFFDFLEIRRSTAPKRVNHDLTITMNCDFLVRPVFMQNAFEADASAGVGYVASNVTRRSFVKTTGGATVAAMVAWQLATGRASAETVGGSAEIPEGDGTGSGSGSGSGSKKYVGLERGAHNTIPPGVKTSTVGAITVIRTDLQGSNSGTTKTIVNESPYWEYDLKAGVMYQAQPTIVTVDCLGCKALAPTLSLLGLPSGITYGPIVGTEFKRGVTVTAGSDPTDPKASHSGPTGQEESSDLNLKIKITAVVDKSDGESKTKSVTWTVEPSTNISVSAVEGVVRAALIAMYPNTSNYSYAVSVNLPAPDLGGARTLTDSTTAVKCDSEPEGGAGCSN